MAVDTEAYRVEFRRKIWPNYSGRVHFAFTNVVLLGLIAGLLARLHGVRPWEWALVPSGFLFANLIEYIAHRYPLHRPYRFSKFIYKAHGIAHHRFFTAESEDAMTTQHHRDYFVVLFGPVSQAIMIFCIGVPASLIAGLLMGRNAGLLFMATSVAYFLTYEWLHLIYHLPSSNLLTKLPGMRALRRHHTAHHDLKLMTKWNFNITFPIFDAILGTTWKPVAEGEKNSSSELHPQQSPAR
jgi:hypothetical protein